MIFSPRLNQILFLLCNAEHPIAAADLAEHLQISKRTVFRELEHVDHQLMKMDIRLETKSKKGISLSGTVQARMNLQEILSDTDAMTPLNKYDRHRRLIWELLKEEEARKAYYFSRILDVSEGTVGKDLEQVEKWFEENNLQLIRKPGVGIYIEYRESDYRKALMRYIYQNMDQPFQMLYQLIGTEIVDNIIQNIQEMGHERVRNFTEHSYIEFIIYLSIMVYRILGGHGINGEISYSGINRQDESFVQNVEAVLEDVFGIDITDGEHAHLYIYIKGVKLQHINETENLTEGYFDLQCTIYEMIHQYDYTIAWLLKNDEDFVKGLMAHLKPTITRLQNDIVIHNPFQEEVQKLYPEVYQKTKRAVKVLEYNLDCEVPDEEAGLLALHFGGAEVRIRNNEKAYRKIRVGVICASGIGMSTLLSSRISQVFGEKIEVQCLSVADLKKEKLNSVEICLSTFELSEVLEEYIQIHPMLTEEDIAKIAMKIDEMYSRPAVEKSVPRYDMLGKMEEINLLTEEITSIVKHFNIYSAGSGSSFQEVVRQAANYLGKTFRDRDCIYHDIFKREALSTQVIPEFGFALLHAKTDGVDNSRFIVILPDESRFTDPYFQGAEAVVVMLITHDDSKDQPAISAVSSGLFDDESFLEALKQGGEKECRHTIEMLLNQYFLNYIKHT